DAFDPATLGADSGAAVVEANLQVGRSDKVAQVGRSNTLVHVSRSNAIVDDLIAEKYRGIRPAFGYPACPDHTEKSTLFRLLGAEAVGITLTESFAMMPAASVSAVYFAHPEARD